ncbi:MAG: hypothetical protein ACK448_08685 [Bacteroidota bacterium]|jgi:uncharacterized membrane protein
MVAAKKLVLGASVLIVFSTGCYYDNKETMYGASGCDTTNVTYSQKIAPLINQKCIGCHSAASATAGVDLSSYNQVVKYGQTKQLQGTINQLPGYESKLMPPGTKLDNCNLSLVDIWLRKGMPQ